MLIVSEKLFNKDLMRELNSELRNSQISQQEKAQENFIQYFKKVIGIRHKKSSKSIIINWHRTVSFLEMFVQNDILSFEKIWAVKQNI